MWALQVSCRLPADAPAYILELLWNLSYEVLKKNKHNSRINSYGNYKIMINSPEVCIGIERQCAKVGCKKLIIFI
jgi:hypothetical protein